jgi:hypothetical protein
MVRLEDGAGLLTWDLLRLAMPKVATNFSIRRVETPSR